jgi:hypothetical protein
MTCLCVDSARTHHRSAGSCPGEGMFEVYRLSLCICKLIEHFISFLLILSAADEVFWQTARREQSAREDADMERQCNDLERDVCVGCFILF